MRERLETSYGLSPDHARNGSGFWHATMGEVPLQHDDEWQHAWDESWRAAWGDWIGYQSDEDPNPEPGRGRGTRRRGVFNTAARVHSNVRLRQQISKSRANAAADGDVNGDTNLGSHHGASDSTPDDPFNLGRSIARSQAGRARAQSRHHAWEQPSSTPEGAAGTRAADAASSFEWLPWCREPAADESLPLDRMVAAATRHAQIVGMLKSRAMQVLCASSNPLAALVPKIHNLVFLFIVSLA